MELLAYTFIGIAIVSYLPLTMVWPLFKNSSRFYRFEPFFYSFAAGALLANLVTHLLPETFEHGVTLQPVAIIGGSFVLFFLLNEVLHRIVHASNETGLWLTTFAGDSLHNFADGVLLAAAFIASPFVGFLTALSLLAHEIPQELAEWSILMKSGLRLRRTVWLNLFGTLFAFAGGLLILGGNFSGETITHWLLPMTCGNFIYLIVARLLPQMIRYELNLHSIYGLLGGGGLVWLSQLFHFHVH